MAIDFGRAARGIATGYLSAKIADTEAQDELNREFILQARKNIFLWLDKLLADLNMPSLPFFLKLMS